MSIGTIMQLPGDISAFGRVRDEHGSARTVHTSEFQEDSEVGDDFPYRVDIYQNKSGSATTLKYETYSPDD